MNAEKDIIGLNIAAKHTIIKMTHNINPIDLKNDIPMLYDAPASGSQTEKLLNK
jgi:hypothetical protein